MNPPTPTLTPAQNAAREILSGADHDGTVRWFGPNAQNQWCWQCRDEAEIARLIAAEYRPLLTELRDAMHRAWKEKMVVVPTYYRNATIALDKALKDSP